MTINYLRLILLAMWLGAAVFFSVVVAPAAFSVLDQMHSMNGRESAGSIVGLCLAVVNLSGFVISLLALISGVFRFRKTVGSVIEAASLLITAVATGIGHWVIRAQLQALKSGFTVSINLIPKDDPRRIAFDTLHGYSVKALGVAMIAALIGLVFITYRLRGNAQLVSVATGRDNRGNH